MWKPLVAVMIVAAVLPVATCAQTPESVATPSPKAIFFQSMRRLESYPGPPYVIERVTWKITSETGEQFAFMRYAYRLSDGLENYTNSTVANGKLPDASVAPAYTGPLAWLVRPPAPASVNGGDAERPDTPDLKTIASVVAFRSDYDVRLAGLETVEGHPTFHLLLRPYGDPKKHNLRELWIDQTSFDLWKAHYVAGCGYCNVPNDVTAYFMPAGNTWVVKRISYQASCRSFSVEACSFDLYTTDIVFVPELPDWLFDKREYLEHKRAGDPDYLGTFMPLQRDAYP